jgi:hypothetical protein
MQQLAGRLSGDAWWRSGRLGRAWHALVALVVVSALDGVLTDELTLWSRLIGPDTATPRLVGATLTAALMALLLMSLLTGRARLARRLMLGLLGLTTLQLLFSAVMLVAKLPDYREGAGAFALLLDAVIVWTITVALFALWYWMLDGGGPDRRLRAPAATLGFLFPLQVNAVPGHANWRPLFIDYLFLAFNASMAFSATDTLIVTGRAKALTMLQAAISLLTITIVTARAVNIIR